ncbi:hypothetical protein M9H77_05477 [Catharanthus roseus]|uniref:Uncharacterized protein n=1 Tax=Catharanthus roseus TaxID=4058 RepID=A0ACC0CH90_CATRO|nr:hypothetical protein M9H77_05477 [Catharanthus roseus]
MAFFFTWSCCIFLLQIAGIFFCCLLQLLLEFLLLSSLQLADSAAEFCTDACNALQRSSQKLSNKGLPQSLSISSQYSSPSSSRRSKKATAALQSINHPKSPFNLRTRFQALKSTLCRKEESEDYPTN